MTYSPYYWEDISSPFPDIGNAQLTRLTFDKTFVFADRQSAKDYARTKRAFIWSNLRDSHYDFNEHFDIPGFESHVLACKSRDG